MIIAVIFIIIKITKRSEDPENMRRSWILILFLLIITTLSAQKTGKQNMISGFEKGYFAGHFIYFPTFINSIGDYTGSFGVDDFDEFIYLYGGEITGNLNQAFGAGLQYFQGYDISQKMVTVADDTSFVRLDRAVRYKISYTALTVNYRKSVYGPFQFYGSFSGGYGGIEIMFSQDYSDQTFEDMCDSFDPDRDLYKYNRSAVYTSDLYVFSAQNGLRFYINSKIALGASVGYTYAFVSEDGVLNYGFESAKNVPDLDFKGVTYGIGFYFGY